MRVSKLLAIAAMAVLLPGAASAAVVYDLTLTSSTVPAFSGTGVLTLDFAPSASGQTDYTAAQVSGLTFNIGGQTFSESDAKAQLSVVRFVDGVLNDITFADEIGASPNRYSLQMTSGYVFAYNNEQNSAYGSMTAALRSPSAIPEPATWGLMILGLGAVGAAMRRGRRLAFAA